MALIAIVHIPDHTADDVIARQHTLEQIHGSRLVGVFDFPAKFELTCDGFCIRKGTGAWGRDRRGFMKCSICGGRNRNIRRWFIGSLFDWFGANLYARAPKAFQTPEGYGIFSRADND